MLKGIITLVTGGAGFIGSHLCRRLVEEKARVFVFVEPNSSLKNIADILDKVVVYEVDITDFESLYKMVKEIGPKKIYHLASFVDVGRGFDKANLAIKTNIQGLVNLLHALEEIDYDCFINTGTCEEYGTNQAPFTEDQIPQPVSPYSASKSAAWLFGNMYARVHNCPIITLRPFTTYGPAQGHNMLVSQLILSCLKGQDFKMSRGEQTREFNYVTDIVDGYIKASLTKQALGETINIGNGQKYKVLDVAQKIVELMGNPIKLLVGSLPYRKREIWHLYCDNRKARQILGWQPKVSLDHGLKKTVEWFNEEFREIKKRDIG